MSETQTIKRGGVLLTRADLDISCAATKDPSRFRLDGIHVTNEATEATNGHYLMRLEGKREIASDDFPCKPETAGPFPEAVDIMLPSEAAKDIAKALPKKSTLPILATALVARQNGHVLAVTTDLQTTNARQIHPMEGTFPNYEKVMPTGEPLASIRLSAAYLKTICDYVTRHGMGGAEKAYVDIESRTDTAYGPAAVKITSEAADGRKIVVVLMPMRVK